MSIADQDEDLWMLEDCASDSQLQPDGTAGNNRSREQLQQGTTTAGTPRQSVEALIWQPEAPRCRKVRWELLFPLLQSECPSSLQQQPYVHICKLRFWQAKGWYPLTHRRHDGFRSECSGKGKLLRRRASKIRVSQANPLCKKEELKLSTPVNVPELEKAL
ncbi:hypothetical protein SKAU_G00062870 [Synaphobranchus kaupii]|uniref:Uncharacterized protein n=1 Tax=Synaphobranchus kaupii TaxID=118154 RepID=A0A9Q1JAY8_SYNKA|nr:hypothetical protein SKAU_G00062870 [Synaphobranchus kaupii]